MGLPVLDTAISGRHVHKVVIVRGSGLQPRRWLRWHVAVADTHARLRRKSRALVRRLTGRSPRALCYPLIQPPLDGVTSWPPTACTTWRANAGTVFTTQSGPTTSAVGPMVPLCEAMPRANPSALP